MRKKQSTTKRRAAGSDDDELDPQATRVEPPPLPPTPPPSHAASATDAPASHSNDAAGTATTPSRTRGGSGGGCGATPPGIYDTVKCTACGKRVNPYNGTMQLHPLLQVLVCQRCYKFYRTGQFDIDQDGKENQCRWCGEGGSLICCDKCQHSFCKTCIRRNLGRSALQSVEELPDDAVWSCYVCDPGPLRDLLSEARVVTQAVRDRYTSEAARRKPKVQQPHPQPKQQQQTQLQHHQQQPLAAASVMGFKLDLSSVPKLPMAAGLPAGFASAASSSSAAAAAARLKQQQQQQLQLQQQRQLQLQQQLQQQQRQRAAAAAAGSSAVMTEQWYKKNVRIEGILADIESVNPYNVGVALRATVSILQGMMRQYSRFLQDLATARTGSDRSQVVSRFKSAYRMHLFLRLGRLRALIAEEERKAAPAAPQASTATATTAAHHQPQLLQRSIRMTMGGAPKPAQLAPQQQPPPPLPIAAKTVFDANGQPIPIAELLPELNRNIREMIERQNRARREAEAAASSTAAASSDSVEGGGGGTAEEFESAGDGVVVLVSDEEAEAEKAAESSAFPELAERRPAGSSRKKSQPRKIILPATNRRVAWAGDGEPADDGDGDNEDGQPRRNGENADTFAAADDSEALTADATEATAPHEDGEAFAHEDVEASAPEDVEASAPEDIEASAPEDVEASAPDDVEASAPEDAEASAPDDAEASAPEDAGGDFSADVAEGFLPDVAESDMAADAAAHLEPEDPFAALWDCAANQAAGKRRGGGGDEGDGDDSEQPPPEKRSRSQSPGETAGAAAGSLETPPSSVVA